ncbi:hypothetical protein HFN20_00510 [Paenibacillus dendritiformis]|uniref:hypothetical protein n=1 Tax=Paenibacillus dendritiformis TaxID=130049 RepID=UPI00143DBC1B|nr:hypothetical protein [Paenibacillus dendritiformis]NKI19730.1 hypothetical protein [Paenibacillus dendritiformis]NRG00539.1 hypothetical protein [Paenibacillus dendritiformis]
MPTLNRAKKRRKALEKIISIVDNSTHSLASHYSCESFYNIPNGRTPRITSIAIRYLGTGQTKSFSIHKVAELKKVPFEEIEEKYNELEREMLSDYYSFVRTHRSFAWVHWNMRDINYGFEALDHRFAVLGGTPESISDDNKVDLSRYLVDIYGLRYIGHPRFQKIIEKNNITSKDMLTGADEAEAFTNKEYVKLHQSTLRKVDCIQTILERVAGGNLETDSKLLDKYGFSIQGIAEMIKENWILQLISAIFMLILGGYIGSLF